MLNQPLKDHLVSHVLRRVQTPAQYLGGEVNIVRKDHREVRGTLCMAFPDAYTIGMPLPYFAEQQHLSCLIQNVRSV